MRGVLRGGTVARAGRAAAAGRGVGQAIDASRARRLSGALALALLLAGALPGGGQPPVSAGAAGAAGAIGVVVLVQGEALAIVAGQPPRQLKFHDPVPGGLRVRLTGRDSVLKVQLFRAAPEGIGTYTLSGRSEAVIQQGPTTAAAGGLVATMQLLLGRLRLALLPGRGESAEVRTPDAVVGIKGTYVRLLVDPALGTFVAVDEGEATVQAIAGGAPVLVKAGHWVLVPPGGVPGRPAPPSALDPNGWILVDPPLPLPRQFGFVP